MSSRRIVVVDCGTSRVSVGVFVEKKDRLSCESLSVAAVTFEGADRWPDSVAAQIRSLARTIPPRSRTILILPSPVTVLKQMRTPRVSPAKSRQVLEFAVGQQIPHLPGEMVWDALHSGSYGEENDYLVAAVKTQMVEPALGALRDRGLEFGSVVPAILALQAAGPFSFAISRARRLLIETGAQGTTFLQTDGSCFAIRALGLSAPRTQTPDAIANAVSDDGILRLAQEATRTLLHFNRQNHFEAPEQVLLATDEMWNHENVARLGEHLKLPVECPQPVPCELVPPDRTTADTTTFARLFGGAAVGLSRAGFALDLVPLEMRKQERTRKRKPWLAAAALLGATALLPPVFRLRLESVALQRESRALSDALAPAQARARRLHELQAHIAALRQETERLQALRRSRTEWLEFFAAMQTRMTAVEDVWLERLQILPAEDGAPMKLMVQGCLLDRESTSLAGKMKNLVRELRTVPGVGAVEERSFDVGRPHLLRFELVLVRNPTPPL